MPSSSQLEVALTRSQLSEALVCLDGSPISFEDYPMFRLIYDGGYDSMLLMTCRQVGKSTTLSNFSIAESIAFDFFKTFFISPSQEQTHKFSTLRVGTTIQFSPNLKKYYSGRGVENRVNLRMFSNGSQIAFSYAKDNADRCRGFSADRVCLDEIQDMLLDAIEPVVRECMSKSKYKWMTRCGTPKSMENPIQGYWQASTQTEWLVKCEACNAWNQLRSEKCLGKLGPVCQRAGCGRYLNVRNGTWVDMNPDAKAHTLTDDPDERASVIKGFHISRPMMPQEVPGCWQPGTAGYRLALKNWRDILDKFEGPKPYSLPMFRNEVLGVSDSVGRRLVTRELLNEMCTGPQMLPKPGPASLQGISMVAAGIDWSGGGTLIKSRTVLWIVGKVAQTQKIRTLYYKIFPGTSPVEEVNEIMNILGMYGPVLKLVGCDAGEGNMPTEMLRRRLGPERVFKYRYGSPKFRVRWDAEGAYYLVNRTWSIDSLMSALQRKEYEFAQNVPAMTPAFDDILNEYEEVTKNGLKVWRHAPDAPDDCLHALNFARMTLQKLTGELDLTS